MSFVVRAAAVAWSMAVVAAGSTHDRQDKVRECVGVAKVATC